MIFEWWLMRLYDALVRKPFVDAVTRPYNAFAIAQVLANPGGWCDQRLQPRSPNCAPQVRSALQQTLTTLQRLITEASSTLSDRVRTVEVAQERFAPVAPSAASAAPSTAPSSQPEHS